MALRPVAVGLTVCDYAVIEKGTEKVSLMGILTKWSAKQFPFTPPPFFFHAALTDGLGDVTLKLIASRLDTDENVYNREIRVSFVDRLRVVQVLLRISNLEIPAAGAYQFSLLAEGAWVAHRRLRVLSEES